MDPIRFEWNPSKAESNRRKHGVSFEEARTAFADEQAIVIDDPDSAEEERFILLGLSATPGCWWSSIVSARPLRSFG